MQITHRPFDDNRGDFEKMWRFLQEDYACRGDQFVWLFSRLGDWKYGLWSEKKYFPNFFNQHAQLWVDAFDQVDGFVLSEDGGSLFFIFTRCGFDYLYADILDWTLRQWGPRYESLQTEIHEHQREAISLLERGGFRPQGAAATTRSYDLRSVPDQATVLPPGFRIQDMRQDPDYRAKGLLFANGFQDKDEVSELDLLKFAHSRRSPAYDAALDLSVVSDAGLHVASCVGFNDPQYSVAEVEKVCTHNRYRRLGLAEAVIRECFRRLRQRGIQTAYITAYGDEADRLYEKLGPISRRQWFHYEWTP